MTHGPALRREGGHELGIRRKFYPRTPPPTHPHTHTQHHLPKHQDVKETQINMLGSFFSLSAAIRLSYGSLIAFDHSSQRRSSSGVATGSHMTGLENSIACKFICSFLFLSCSLRPLSMYSARIQQSVPFESIPLLLYPVTPDSARWEILPPQEWSGSVLLLFVRLSIWQQVLSIHS